MVRQNYSSEDAYSMLIEIQNRIYGQYPGIIEKSSSESLAGAKMYISEIIQKYNNRISHDLENTNPNDIIVSVDDGKGGKNADQLAVKIKQEFRQSNTPLEEDVLYKYCRKRIINNQQIMILNMTK